MGRSTLFVALAVVAGCSGGSGDLGDGGDDTAMSDEGGPDGSMGNDATSGDTGTHDGSNGNDAGVDMGVDNSPDGFGAARTACINEINKLRATESHPAYALWETAAIDMCVDQQATYDQTANSAHDAWLHGVYPTCNGNAQDECLGYGTSPSEVVACLDAMWNERLQSNCSSCPSCNGPTLNSNVIACENTPTCDFYGKYGKECGHYCNMSADYFTEAACGFSTTGTSKDWAVQNFK